MHDPAKSTVQQDNERTRVTLWEFIPDAATGWHIHEMDYVIVPLTTGKLKLLDREGNESEADLTNGISYFGRRK
jgi:quercetin dioxygenase-like cupin family protein